MQKIVLLLLVFFSCLGIGQKKKEIDSLLSNIARLEKPETHIEANANKTDKILKMGTEAYYQAKEIDYKDGQTRALHSIVKNYIYTGELKKALEKINEGLALTNGENQLQKYRISFFMFKASVLFQLGYSDEAKANYNNAVETIEKVPEYSVDKEHYKRVLEHASYIIFYEQKKAQIPGNIKQKEQYLLDTYKEVKQIKNNTDIKTILYVSSLRSLISYYTELNDTNKAEQYLAEGDSLYSDFPVWLIKRNLLLGNIEKKKKNYTKAIEAYNDALKTAGEYQRKYEQSQIYNQIAECYHELKDYKNESLYLDKSKHLNKSIDINEKATAGDVLKQESKNKNETNSSLDVTKLYYIIAIPFLIVLLIIILKRKTIKSNTADVITEKPVENEDETEKLDHETLNQLINLAEEDDPSFYFKFNDTFPDFSENLLKICPKLTQSDLEYCAMMKLNFDTKKIASIKRLSIGAVESKKYRIRKKLDISTEENIYIWLMDK
ncbi:tetratricopeptide repeat protein [Elizabethkingia miricola]|uniref:tetratricopeptide repeat protein n=1 Tax=Elizabethkingia bruuniana TaxID=1756149 RepID=UPI0009992FD4|nr:hypothetical protein [Elizabethkingia bruuniana]OPC54133.1 hypothetical protein BAY07_09990 [Elizabethkingia bruuniana]OPC64808.1 hypothetical protein BAY13_03610 [Elizabethkingia bruuniana]RBI92314.1 tetratricopeptide repeat protein [Elizabethkingia miricola]